MKKFLFVFSILVLVFALFLSQINTSYAKKNPCDKGKVDQQCASSDLLYVSGVRVVVANTHRIYLIATGPWNTCGYINESVVEKGHNITISLIQRGANNCIHPYYIKPYSVPILLYGHKTGVYNIEVNNYSVKIKIKHIK